MIPLLTPEGYAQTKVKLANMEARLAALRARAAVSTIHLKEVEYSYLDMIRQYRREIKLYETAHGQSESGTNNGGVDQETTAGENLVRED